MVKAGPLSILSACLKITYHRLMQLLSPRHLADFNTLLLALHAERREEVLPGVIVAGLGALINAPYVVCRIVAAADHSSRRSMSVADRWGPLASTYEDVRRDDPLANRRRDFPGVAAIAISDFIDRRAWRVLPFYRSFCRPFGIEDQLSIECPHGADGTLHVVISRGDFGRFAPAERWILDLLRPHLVQVCGPRPAPRPSEDAAALVESALGEAVLIFDDLTGHLSCTEQTLRLVESVASPSEQSGLPASERSAIAFSRTMSKLSVFASAESGRVGERRDAYGTGYSSMSFGINRRVFGGGLGLTATRLAENETLLGGMLRSIYAAPGSTTYFLDSDVTRSLGSGWTLAADYRRGWTTSSFGRMTSSAFSIDLAKSGLFGGDRVAFRLSQPLRIENGGLTLSLPTKWDYATASPLTGERSMSLSPSGREITIEAGYFRLTPTGSIDFHVFVRRDPNHVAGSPPDMGSAIRAQLAL